MSKTFRAEPKKEKRRRPKNKKSKRGFSKQQIREVYVEFVDKKRVTIKSWVYSTIFFS